jgi:hypothetical protein
MLLGSTRTQVRAALEYPRICVAASGYHQLLHHRHTTLALLWEGRRWIAHSGIC